jgi:SAM-dependent methyltransferase
MGPGSDTDWERQAAVAVHDETAARFALEYGGERDYHRDAFLYGRHFIDQHWQRCVDAVPAGGRVLDIGCGVGEYLSRLEGKGLSLQGIEPSSEMRRRAEEQLPAGTVQDGSVLSLPFADDTFDFAYSIEVFRYLNSTDNDAGHREVLRVVKPGGIYFGTYVNRLAADGFIALVGLRKLRHALTRSGLRCHTEFETPNSLRQRFTRAGFAEIELQGAMLAPLRIAYRLRVGPPIARWVDRAEPWTGANPLLKAFSGHLIGIARKPSGE